MPFINVRGAGINYQVLGDSGAWVALSPGGRRPLEAVKTMAARVAAAGYRVLIHDRRNCGLSDVAIGGEESEAEIWAHDLSELLTQLGAAPAIVGGGSSGARLALLLALRHPQNVHALFLWRVSGGRFAAARLAELYYGQYIKIAERGGMRAICEAEHFRDRISAKPSNRERLLAIDPRLFIAAMGRWRDNLLKTSDEPVVGLTEAELRAIKLPACVVPGNDRTHPQDASRALARALPHAELHEFFGEDIDADVAPLDVWDKKEADLTALCLEFFKRVSH
jgi:pimeloyl-ACP methyl ester carboxylesterase